MPLLHIGLPVALTLLAVVLLLLRRGLRRAGRVGLSPADDVTLVRAVLTCMAASLVPHAPDDAMAITGLTVVASLALVLDGVDGRLARSTGSASPFGARFDMEVDALLVLVLSVHVARFQGAWVLLIGAARYLLLGASWLWPWLDREVPPRRWAKIVAVVQGVVLIATGTGLLPTPVATVALGLALALLAESFGHQVNQLWILHRELDLVGADLARDG